MNIRLQYSNIITHFLNTLCFKNLSNRLITWSNKYCFRKWEFNFITEIWSSQISHFFEKNVYHQFSDMQKTIWKRPIFRLVCLSLLKMRIYLLLNGTKWTLGWISKLHSGDNGLTRVVTLSTAKGEITWDYFIAAKKRILKIYIFS